MQTIIIILLIALFLWNVLLSLFILAILSHDIEVDKRLGITYDKKNK